MSGNVTITVADGGTGQVVVPGASVRFVAGCSQKGTVGQVVATRSPSTILSTFGFGPMSELAALICLAGGTALCCRTTNTTNGSATAVQFTGTGTSVITVSGLPYDDYFVAFKVVTGGTIGVAGITFQLSLDGGRTYGPIIALGTANTYAIPNTNLTLNFGAGTLVAADIAKFSTTAPQWNDAGVQVALQAFQASQYAGAGIGGVDVAANLSVGAAGADISAFEGYLDTLANGYLFTRMYTSARDNHAPTAWGGAGETEANWMTAIGADYSAASAKRITSWAGAYNMPSAFPNNVAGAPRYRRPLHWAMAARRCRIAPQRHAGRVRDGSLTNIVVDPVNDPVDGFVYHDERLNPGLDFLFAGTGTNRFGAATTRIPNLPGYYCTNPLLLSPQGSDFLIDPLGAVMDIACSIVQQIGQQNINDDVRLNPSGTLYVNDLLAIQNTIQNVVNAQMVATNMISSAVVTVDPTVNVQATKNVVITVTIVARGYILSETITIGFQNTAAAAPAGG